MTVDPVPGLRSALRTLRADVGDPSYRLLTRQAELVGDDLGTSTIGDLIGKSATGLPRLASVEAFLAACLKHHQANARSGRVVRRLVPEARFEPGWLAAKFPEEFALIADANKRKARPRSPSPKYRATLREIAGRTRSMSGRELELSELARFAQSDETYRLIVGEAWTGKSALLAALCVHLIDNEASLPVDVVCHFLSRREADADVSKFLDAAIPQLAWLVDDPSAATTIDLAQFRFLWDRAVDKAAEAQRHLLLVVDGLDEDLHPPGSLSVSAILPTRLGPYAHVLVSSRPRPALPSDLPVGHPLRESEPAELAPFLGSQELRLLAIQEIEDMVGEDTDELAIDILGLLTAAGGPLAVEEIAAILHGEEQSRGSIRQIRQLMSKRAARSLQSAGDTHGSSVPRYQFAHLSLLEHARTHPELSDPEHARRIHGWAEQRRRQTWRSGDMPGSMFLLDTYPDMLGNHSDHQRLAALTSNADWIVAAVVSLGVDVALARLHQAAVAAPADQALKDAIAVVTGQTFHLRRYTGPLRRGYVLQQLCLQAYELGCDDLAIVFRSRIIDEPAALWAPTWTTRLASRTLSSEIGRHTGGISSVAVLADGRVVSGGHNDGRVLLWDPANPGTARAGFQGEEGEITSSVLVLPDGRIAFGAEGDEGSVRVWDPGHPDSQPVELGKYNGGVVGSIVLLPDGRIITSGGGGDFRALVWDPKKPGGVPIEPIGSLNRDVYGVSAFPDGRLAVLTRSGDITVHSSDDQILPIGKHKGAYSVRVLQDGRLLTFGSAPDGAMLIWDPATPEEDPVTLGMHSAFGQGVTELPDGQIVTCSLRDGIVLLWDPTRPSSGAVELGRHDGYGTAAAALPDGRVVTGGYDGRVLVWDPQAAPPRNASAIADGKVTALAVLADERVVTCRFHDDRRILLWDPRTPARGEVCIGTLAWWTKGIAVLNDGRLAIGEFTTGEVSVWDLSRSEAVKVVLGHHPKGVSNVVPLPDGRLATESHMSSDVMVWDPAQPDAEPLLLPRLGESSGYVAGLLHGRVGGDAVTGPQFGFSPRYGLIAILPDGTEVTCPADGEILLWDPSASHSKPRHLGSQPEGISTVAVLPDGRLVTGSAERAVIWNPSNPAQTVELGCSVAALAVGTSPTGAAILAIAHDGYGWSLWRETIPTTIR
ncbi:hypothetical protein [Streptomyces sp. NPDC056785]|uniref:hypothetical protein n=1 Tax=Streptomyces sp. NPDC056785 TaxID=3345944 RepID=UPI0036960035